MTLASAKTDLTPLRCALCATKIQGEPHWVQVDGERYPAEDATCARLLRENPMAALVLLVGAWALFSRPASGGESLAVGQRPPDFRLTDAFGRTITRTSLVGDQPGLIKIVADAESDQLLGASVLLAEGAEVVHELVSAIALGARYTDLRSLIHIHPTLAEGLSSALGGVHYEEGI